MITSRSNPTVKWIRSLRNRRERTESGMLFAEGIRLLGEAYEAGMTFAQLVGTADRIRSPFAKDLVQKLIDKGVPYLEVSDDVYESLTDSEGRQGLCAVIQQRWTPLDEVEPEAGRVWVAMNSIQYPGNLGTIMRTMEAVAGAGIILLGPTTDPYDPAAVRASTGACFSLKLVRTDLGAFARWKHRWNVNLVAADVGASASYREVTYRQPTILLMGAERDGLTAEQKALCDTLIGIPMVGRSDSLNVAVAASVVLYEIFYQSTRH